MEDYQRRVIAEHDELSERMSRLKDFFSADTFLGLEDEDKNLLKVQYTQMGEYRSTLKKRISRFGGTNV